MAGRGRGRGYGPTMSFDTAALGIGRGDMPAPVLQPPAAFPPLEFQPVPLETSGGDSGWEYDYLLALKQEFRATMQDSPYYLKPKEKRDIERYSDKYKSKNQEGSQKWKPDWKRFPKELRRVMKKTKISSTIRAKMKPNLPPPSKKSKISAAEGLEIDDKLEKLSKNETEDEEKKPEDENKPKKEQEEPGSGDEFEDDEEYDEEVMEEGTDYITTYFDNGEEYGLSEDDGLEEGPVF